MRGKTSTRIRNCFCSNEIAIKRSQKDLLIDYGNYRFVASFKTGWLNDISTGLIFVDALTGADDPDDVMQAS